jgi:hypothetical protein
VSTQYDVAVSNVDPEPGSPDSGFPCFPQSLQVNSGTTFVPQIMIDRVGPHTYQFIKIKTDPKGLIFKHVTRHSLHISHKT